MVSDFIGAAFPWILMGLFVAISCSLMSKKKKKKQNKFAFVKRSGTMKSPAGTLSDRTVLPKARWRGFAPTSSRLPKKKESIK